MKPPSVHSKNIVVFGDIMLDVKLSGSIYRMANEAPVPILLQDAENKYLGGGGNVLMNLQSMGCERLFIFSKIGNDSYGKEISNILSSYPEIEAHLYSDSIYQTSVKTRGFSNNKMIFRYDIENTVELLQSHVSDIKQKLIHILSTTRIDSIILSDYNRGFLVKELAQFIIEEANKKSIPTFVDTKSDYKKYLGCTVIKPNRKEIEDVFGIHYSYDNLENIHKAIKEKVQCKETLLTLSEDGMSFYTDDKLIYENTQACDVNDVTGAGDVVLSIIAYYYSSLDKRRLIQLATSLGTMSVRHVGTYVLKPSDILNAYKKIHDSKLISLENVKYLKNPIVFTNGCFDILHEGHMALLQYCRSIRPPEGEVLIAINSDDSIRKLKGPTRPINHIDARIAILNNIESVDWILVFTEDTPYEVLETIHPHTIVKGGDYTIESMIGKEFAKEVKIFSYMDGKSTTNIVNKIALQNRYGEKTFS
jgi:D-beta-D-heptose 7-phosphate kinase/D-beta-D-heptose 1-phosphate adenosyltransferase